MTDSRLLLLACAAGLLLAVTSQAELDVQAIIVDPPTAQDGGRTIAVPEPTGHSSTTGTEPDGADLLTFLNNDKLHGKLLSATGAKGLCWERDDMPAALDFSMDGIAKVALGSGKKNANNLPSAWVELSNEDVLSGSILSLDDKHLVFDTWYSGKLSIKRSMISILRPNALGSFTIYEGPGDLAQWKTHSRGKGENWELRKGSLYALQSYPIGRNIDNLPDTASIEFTASWRGYPQFYFSFYTDTLNTYYGNCYLLSVSHSSVYLQRYSKQGSQHSLGNITVPEFQKNTKKTARFNVLVDKKKKTFALLIDGKLVKEWTDTNAFAGKGNGILFQPQSTANLKISKIRIVKWDGKIPKEGSTEASTTEDFARFTNNDKVSGQLLSIKDGMASFKTSYATLPVPMERISEITFAEDKRERARRNKLDIRCHFTGDGAVTCQLTGIEDGKLTGTSENFGALTAPVHAFRQLDFNIYTEREESDEDDF